MTTIQDLFTDAVKNNKIEIAKELIKCKDIDATKPKYIYRAVLKNYIDMCKLLIDNGADINHKYRKEKQTLLDICFWEYGYEKICILLVKSGIDLESLDFECNTYLHNAARSDYIELCKVLLEYGLDPTITNEDGNTASDLADSSEIKELLNPKNRIIDELRREITELQDSKNHLIAENEELKKKLKA